MPTRHSIEPLRRCIVLYAEDDDATAYLFQLALAEAGIKLDVVRVTNGEEVLSFIKKTGVYEDAPTPDLLLLDLNLPRKNGLEVLAELRPITHNNLDVVVFSSSDAAQDKARALALGAKDYLVKSADFDGFVDTVRDICALIPAGPVFKTA